MDEKMTTRFVDEKKPFKWRRGHTRKPASAAKKAARKGPIEENIWTPDPGSI